MQIKKGRDRIVFILPIIGIVIKIPIIHFLRVIEHHFSLFKSRNIYKKGTIKKIFFMYFEGDFEYRHCFKGTIFGGIHSNWLEYVFWRRTKNPFLKPTYFSLFGLINIQKYGAICTLKEVDLHCQLYEMTDGRVFDNGHHFCNPANYTLESDQLQMVDYGNSRVYRVIVRYGKKITTKFDPKYNWEEVKKKLEQEGL